ncbi:MAG: histidine--tRNA ligase [Thaumarchaeota archaeon]|nr:histidine--tRNA ligase [Nitrososphaerota archaeon]
MPLDTPRGMDDLLPEEVALKRKIEEVIREVFELYGYLEIETPTVEYYELFAAKSGEEIRERMFDFRDKAGRRLVLRPEVTASIARVVSTKLKAWPQPIRLGYIADCYRYDEPQWGRRRRFWQGGFELFGSRSPLADAEILQVSYDVFSRLGLEKQFFKIGHIGILRNILEEAGVGEEDQNRILSLLDRKLIDEASEFMSDIGLNSDAVAALMKLIRLEGRDKERIFREARDILSPWSKAGEKLENLIEIVETAVEAGVNAPMIISPGLARGLEYYDGFIFEQGVEGVQVSLNGGGRYDRLVELFGGKPTPGVGCAIGITRIMHYMLDKLSVKPRPREPETLLVGVPRVSNRYIAKVAGRLRKLGIPVEVEVTGKRVPSAIEYALKKGMKFVIIVGEKEEEKGEISVKNLERRTQIEVLLSDEKRILEAFERI